MTISGKVYSEPLANSTLESANTSLPSRREFLTYVWAGALAAVGLQSAAAGFLFLRPRFRTGQFGGEFVLGKRGNLPPIDAPPAPISEGKFWLVNTAQGPKAIYMVCTHLGCLYKWETENNRFHCPCHGSEFSREGELLKGPAARALDQFTVKVLVDGKVATESIDQGHQVIPPTIIDDEAQIVVDTGKKIVGR